VLSQPAVPWSISQLVGHRCCLLVTTRRDGRLVTTPMWFAPAQRDVIVLRSGAADAKLTRIRRSPDVLIAPCDIRGRPLGPPMRGSARILERAEEDDAEAVLANALGFKRRAYNIVRAPLLPMAYLEVHAAVGGD
jgi:hypothetical protein